jgi:hypothetical protein
VPYYPLTGQLREVEVWKLGVDCTSEGLMSVEADADMRLTNLEVAAATWLTPPFPCMDQLLFDMDDSSGVRDCPLLLVQVTRLLCGGFIFAIQLNHTICEAIGLAQFVSAIADLARGLPPPKAAPTWSRELLEARIPPKLAFPHREFNAVPPSPPPPGDMVMRTFTFGPNDVVAIKRDLPPNLAATTNFEVLTTALWRALTAALDLPPDERRCGWYPSSTSGVCPSWGSLLATTTTRACPWLW